MLERKTLNNIKSRLIIDYDDLKYINGDELEGVSFKEAESICAENIEPIRNMFDNNFDVNTKTQTYFFSDEFECEYNLTKNKNFQNNDFLDLLLKNKNFYNQ